MTQQHVFISYSRQQFYFVESLVLSLQSYGVAPWFDVQRIYPGADWEQVITEGLRTSSEFVLVASRAALASPHVKKEWEQALKMDIPIYVVLFEPLSLPAQLKNATVIDMCRAFEKRAPLLAQLLLTKQKNYQEKNIPTSTRGNWWSAGPLSIIIPLWLFALLSTIGLATISAVVIIKIIALPDQPMFQIPAILAIVINCLFLSGFMFMQPWRFSRREVFNTRMYTLSLYVLPIDIATLLTFNLFFFHRVLSSMPTLLATLQDQYSWSIDACMVFVFGGIVCGVSVLWLLRTINALHWFRTGSAPDELRSRANAKWLLPWRFAPTSTTIKTYRLYYHPDNQHIADNIVAALEKNPYLQRGKAGQHIDYHIALLTSSVTISAFRRLLKATAHLVYIIGTNIRLPSDGQPSLRFQWIDYRKRQPEQLQSLVNLLHHGSIYVKGYGFSVLPEATERKVLPEAIAFLAILFRCSAAVSVSISFFIFFLNWNIILRMGIALIAVLGGVYVFHSADKLENYTLSRLVLKMNYSIVLLCMILFDTLAICIVPNISSASLLTFISLGISIFPITSIMIYFLAHFFFVRKRKFKAKDILRAFVFVVMFSLMSRLCTFLAIPIPDSMLNPWLYTVAPSIVIACFFSAFVLSFPLMSFFSLKRIDSLLPPQIDARQKKGMEPTLAVPAHIWYQYVFYLLISLEIALLFLTQI